MPDYSEYLTPERLAIEDESWGRTRHYARNGQAVVDVIERFGTECRIVEFGAGTGWLARFVLKNAGQFVSRYWAVDKNADEVRVASSKLDRYKQGITVECDVRDWEPTASQPEITCAFAFLKHFSRDEWESVLRKMLKCASRFSLFELNVSHVGEYLDTGPVEDGVRQFPCLSVPNDEALRIVADEGFRVIERTVMASGPQGWETLFIVERMA